jgi:hypothetical protein
MFMAMRFNVLVEANYPAHEGHRKAETGLENRLCSGDAPFDEKSGSAVVS